MTEKKVKVRIIEEKDFELLEEAPPNFHEWFKCTEKWERFKEDDDQ